MRPIQILFYSNPQPDARVHALTSLGRSAPEDGPTGTYVYHFEDDTHIGKRTYYRTRNSSTQPHTSSNTDAQTSDDDDDDDDNNDEAAQLVCRVNFHEEQIGGPMTLSVDEHYVARVRVPTAGHDRRPRVVVCDIESGAEFVLDCDATCGEICNVEFGPQLPPSSSITTTATTIGTPPVHSLFLTTTNIIGRPDAVRACIFDGTKFTTPTLVLQQHDEKYFVDVQRTKGCDYVVVQSTSKMDNEVHLVGGWGHASHQTQRFLQTKGEASFMNQNYQPN